MSSSQNSGSLASDVITYIGVPLAVIGILPVFYNTVLTLAASYKINRWLKRSKLQSSTSVRSDIINRVIEVEFERYAITPLDRSYQKSGYWELSPEPSLLEGGTWSIFQWKKQSIGRKTQRVQYADQLRQPQSEVDFSDLVSYLLDLGAVPNQQGWGALRSRELWISTGSELMKSPDGCYGALKIASRDDSDGHLSLSLTWLQGWTVRNASSLPPYSVCLSQPATLPEKEKVREGLDGPETRPAGTPEDSAPRWLNSSPDQEKGTNGAAIICEISADGLLVAESTNEASQDGSVPTSHKFRIDHLQIRSGSLNGIWFASAATAYGTTSRTALWKYQIPHEILDFARHGTIPCGVLVMLGFVDESATPHWAPDSTSPQTPPPDFSYARRTPSMSPTRQIENWKPHEQYTAQDRTRIEQQRRIQDMHDEVLLADQSRTARISAAFQSSKWDAKLVAEHNLRWLKRSGYIEQPLTLEEAAGAVLYRMVRDVEFASSVFKVLCSWKTWVASGGMRMSDFSALQDVQVAFAHGSVLLALIKRAAAREDGTLSLDIQECIGRWRTVRLG
ncbi:hypothetical protein NKR23_g6718 [Pleurostoma richardsiae]|uniref:Uncharacterized protein n=1 Tax=Pleurostoma richardsiae TaxID=41990 RepID=A0AA38RJX2_9PEZI|nr:hypothetical protein NKR23_g6718 [Pleurostoma richardsiae]